MCLPYFKIVCLFCIHLRDILERKSGGDPVWNVNQRNRSHEKGAYDVVLLTEERYRLQLTAMQQDFASRYPWLQYLHRILRKA